MYRNTYALINKDIIRNNVKEITTKYNDYKYYIGVVKNNAYSHGIDVIPALIDSGINYLAVSSLDEAMAIRNDYKDIPVFSKYDMDSLYDKLILTPNYDIYNVISKDIDFSNNFIIYKDKNINLNKSMKVKTCLFSPLFFVTYVPCALRTLFKKEVKWKPIEHTGKDVTNNKEKTPN